MRISTVESTTRLVDSITSHSLDLFKRYGYRKTTVADITASLRISKKTLYEIFASKEDILREAIWCDIKKAVESFDRSQTANTGSDKLLLSFCRFILIDRIKHGKTGYFWGLYTNDTSIQKATQSALKRIFFSIYQDGAGKGLFKPVQATLASDLIMNMLLGAIDHFSEYREPLTMFNETLTVIADATANTRRAGVNRKA